jgi:hypothetical protein
MNFVFVSMETTNKQQKNTALLGLTTNEYRTTDKVQKPSNPEYKKTVNSIILNKVGCRVEAGSNTSTVPFFFIWFVRLLALRPLLTYCASLG